MKEGPILMNSPMVRATLADHKTNTRREIIRLGGFGKITQFGRSDTPGYDWHFRDSAMRWHDLLHSQLIKACPYGQSGDRLWVRETFVQGFEYDPVTDRLRQFDEDGNELPKKIWYRATDSISWSDDAGWETNVPWKPSIHMPRSACRILLEITGVRVERLQDISNADCWAEGIEEVDGTLDPLKICELAKRMGRCIDDPSPTFAALWESISGPGSWDANPWVWVIEFRRIK
ncbi:hypothetical protein [Herbaspirillum huttiense]|uniref:hypothetical protein n=1 Tax=Herbaspirillum huttiense TaxID=863372 RepID=UPI00040061AA|nr:hypothetical protein [Herbaspirillum huttiense]